MKPTINIPSKLASTGLITPDPSKGNNHQDYVENDPARNIGLQASVNDRIEKNSVGHKNVHDNASIMGFQFIRKPLKKPLSNVVLANALQASGLPRPGVTHKPDLQTNLLFNMATDKKGHTTIASEKNMNPVIGQLVKQAIPGNIQSLKSFDNDQGQAQLLIMYKKNQTTSGIMALTRQQDGAIGVASHSQAVNHGRPGDTPVIQVGRDGTSLIQSVHAKKDTLSAKIETPPEILTNLLTGTYATANGNLYKLHEQAIYQFDNRKQQWSETGCGNNNDRLMMSSKGDLYAQQGDKLLNVDTLKNIKSSIPADKIKHISSDGGIVGLSKSSGNASSQNILLGNINTEKYELLTPKLPENSHILDIIQANDKIWLSVATPNKDTRETEQQLFKTHRMPSNDSTQLAPLEAVSKTLMGAELGDYKITSFISASDNSIHIKLTDDQQQQHLASFDAETGKLGGGSSTEMGSSWVLSGATAIENTQGMSQPGIESAVKMQNGSQLVLSNNAIAIKDASTRELHPTVFSSGVIDISSDISGKHAFALIDGEVIALEVSAPSENYTLSPYPKASYAQSDGTSILIKDTFPGKDIKAFAAASPDMIVQLGRDGLSSTNNKPADTTIPLQQLPEEGRLAQLAFDGGHNLYALSDSGKLYKLSADNLEKMLNDIDSASSQEWTSIEIPEDMQIQNITTAKLAKISLDDKENHKTQTVSEGNHLERYPRQDVSSPYNDFAQRTQNSGHVYATESNESGTTLKLNSKKQKIVTQVGNWAANIKDIPVVSVQNIQNAARLKIQGSHLGKPLAEQAAKIHEELQVTKTQLQSIENTSELPMLDRIQSLRGNIPETAKNFEQFYSELSKRLEDTLTQAAEERGLINSLTGQTELSNKQVGKDYGSNRDLINILYALEEKLGSEYSERTKNILATFRESNQGLIPSERTQSQKSLQVSKEHIALIANQLAELHTQLTASEALTQNANKETLRNIDRDQAKEIAELHSAYSQSPIVQESQKGITNYKQINNLEQIMSGITHALDRPNSALARRLREKCGTADYESTMKAMLDVAKSLPEGSTIQIGQKVTLDFGYAAFRLGLPGNDQLQIGAIAELEGSVGTTGKLTLSTNASGDLIVGLSNKKDLSVSGLLGGSVALGSNATPIQIGDADAAQDARGKFSIFALLFLTASAEGGREKGNTLVIPADKKDDFLDKLFGGQSATQAGKLLQANAAQTSTYTQKSFEANAAARLGAGFRANGSSNLGIGRDAQPSIRLQPEILARLEAFDLSYGKLKEISEGAKHNKQTDQMLHLLPKAFLRARVHEAHAVNLQAGDSFVFGGKPGTAENGGTGITENYHEALSVLKKKTIVDHDAKLDSKFDGTSKTARNISKQDYLIAMMNLEKSLEIDYPNLSKKIQSNIVLMAKTQEDDFQEQAKPIINESCALLASYDSHSKLNNQQIAAINTLAILDIHKEAHEAKAKLQSNIQYTVSVENFNLLRDEGTINRLSRNLGIHPQVDATPQMARLMSKSPDLSEVIQNAADMGGAATLKLGFHPDLQKKIDTLSAKNELTHEIIDNLSKGSGNDIIKQDGKWLVVKNNRISESNLVPVELSVTKSNDRNKNHSTLTPYLKPSITTQVGTTDSLLKVAFHYKTGSQDPIGFNVQRKNQSANDQIAVKMAESENIAVKSYKS